MLDAVLDLSRHNPVDSFWNISKSGVVGILHKATDGGTYVDPTFHAHMKRMAETPLLRGCYHWGNSTNAQKQAYNFLSVAKQAGPVKDLLLALDWETDSKNGDMTTEGAEIFVEIVRKETGRWPLLYSGMAFFNDHVEKLAGQSSPLRNCPLWIARYHSIPPKLAAGWGPWSLWQYTSTGSCPGVQGHVDRSKFEGTGAALAKWWKDCGR